MAKVSKEAQRLYDAFKHRFMAPEDAATLLKDAKSELRFNGSPFAFMERANDILDGNGVERLRSSNGRAKAYYVNMGDTYDTTLIYQSAPTERFIVGSWGDWLESQEMRGNRFDGMSGGGFIG